MKDYKQKFEECIAYLNSVRFPCGGWEEDKKCFGRLEEEFSPRRDDEETKALWYTLKQLICEKRMYRINKNKTAEELFAGWDE